VDSLVAEHGDVPWSSNWVDRLTTLVADRMDQETADRYLGAMRYRQEQGLPLVRQARTENGH
jgi:hypothetical protein